MATTVETTPSCSVKIANNLLPKFAALFYSDYTKKVSKLVLVYEVAKILGFIHLSWEFVIHFDQLISKRKVSFAVELIGLCASEGFLWSKHYYMCAAMAYTKIFCYCGQFVFVIFQPLAVILNSRLCTRLFCLSVIESTYWTCWTFYQ